MQAFQHASPTLPAGLLAPGSWLAASGLNEGEEIITGSYKIIRTLRNDAKIKVDNKSPVKAES